MGRKKISRTPEIIYLSGVPVKKVVRKDLGAMLSPYIQNKLDLRETLWAMDTGTFSLTGSRVFEADKYRQRIEKYEEARHTCLFITCPDEVGNAINTLNLWAEWRLWIGEFGLPTAFVGQDGLGDVWDKVPWEELDVFFIGGTTGWKLSEEASWFAREASVRGKWVHMGRVNSRKRMMLAHSWGCKSVDGTLLKYGPDIHLPNLCRWLNEINSGEGLGG